jgi:hypothetical protein
MGKVTFYVTAFTFTQNLYISSENVDYFKISDSTSTQTGSGGLKVSSSSVNAGLDYYMNDKNNLSFNISYKPIGQDIDMLSQSLLYSNDTPVNTISTVTANGTHSDETTVSLFYKRTFKKPIQEFTADANFYTFKSKDANDFTNNRYLYDSDSMINTFTRLEDVLNERNYLSVKLDYVQPLGLSAKLEAGYQFYYQQMNYDFTTNHLESNNLFTYQELRNSVYGGFTYNVKKFGFQAVVRLENSNISADSVSDPQYACVLPSVNLQYKISASHNLKFTYNRRINRPGIYDLDPYWRVGSNYEISQGNPNLKPEYRDRLQLTYTWNFGSNYFSPYVYNEFLSDKIGRRYALIQSPTDSFMTTFTKPFNLLSGYEYGAGVNAMLWFVNINARFYKGHFDEYTGQAIPIPARDYFSYAITSYAYKNLDKAKKTTAFVFFSYNGVVQDAQSKTYSTPFYGLGAQHQLKDHTFGVFWLLPFSKDIKFQKRETDTPTYHNTNTIGFDVSYYIQFMYSYKFNKGKNVKKLDRKVEVESDSKTQGIGR